MQDSHEPEQNVAVSHIQKWGQNKLTTWGEMRQGFCFFLRSQLILLVEEVGFLSGMQRAKRERNVVTFLLHTPKIGGHCLVLDKSISPSSFPLFIGYLFT